MEKEHLITLQNILFDYIPFSVIHHFKNGYYLPLAYFFLSNKTKITYIKMWQFLQNLCLEFCKDSFKMYTIHVDFEIGSHQAIQEVFEDVEIVRC